MLVGDGPLKKEIEQKVNRLNLTNKVFFTGTKSNVSDYYQTMDVFVLPSFQEAYPVVAVEAQTNGLPCIFSNNMTNKVVLFNSKQLSLNLSAKQWSDEILKYKNFIRKDESENVKNKGFDIKETAKQIENLYFKFEG